LSLKICMIGCGSFARLCHGPAQRRYCASHPDAELAACCDADPGRSREYAEAFGFGRFYSEMHAMLSAERPDAVVMAVPPAAACAAACPVLERGFPLLLEKPPGMTPGELGRLIAAAGKGGGRAQVAFNRRYMPVVRRAMEILGGAFPPGSVDRIDYEMTRHERWDPDFSTTAVHALDAALFLARSPFRSAEIRIQPRRSGEREAADVALDAECATGTRVLVRVQPVSAANEESAAIHAAGQSLALRIPVSPQSEGDGRVEHWSAGALVDSFSDRGFGAVDRLGVSGETEAFLDAVRSGGPVSPGLGDCRQQVALMEAIRARRSGPVDFESP
jgi:predicted dehydrogenase